MSPSGAKLLDFGLVKWRPLESPTSEFSSTETNNPPLTSEGVVLGTLQYMAPEQLEGREVDARTDIFSFGVIVYEMVTGRRAFQGDRQASLIAAILSSDPPPISRLQPLVPDALDHLVKTRLVKQPEERWQSAHDLKSELEWIAASGRISTVTGSPNVRRPKIERLALTILSILFCLSLAALALSYLHTALLRKTRHGPFVFPCPHWGNPLRGLVGSPFPQMGNDWQCLERLESTFDRSGPLKLNSYRKASPRGTHCSGLQIAGISPSSPRET